jgi:membrane protease YdiL (CAAX protease family)
MSRLKTWCLTPSGVISVCTVLTLLIVSETLFAPWAPYFVLYAAAAIALPLWLKPPRRAVPFQKSQLGLAALILVLCVVWNVGIAGKLYDRALLAWGVGNGSTLPSLAIARLLAAAAAHLTLSNQTALALFGAFVVLWAPVGEELFYRVYAFGALRQRLSFSSASLISASFFGARHAAHHLFLWPDVPWVAAAHWVVATFVFGLAMNFLYEKTQRLWLLVLVHFLMNVIAFALQ